MCFRMFLLIRFTSHELLCSLVVLSSEPNGAEVIWQRATQLGRELAGTGPHQSDCGTAPGSGHLLQC